MKQLFISLLLLVTQVSHGAKRTNNVFSFHLLSEVHDIDPARIRGSSGAYLFSNTYRGLFRYSRKEGLVAEGARKCHWIKPTKLSCTLDPSFKFSDGSVVTAMDYVRSWQNLVDAKTMTVQSEMVLPIRNAADILAGKKPMTDLAVHAPKPFKLEIELAHEQTDFVYNLANPVLAPIKQFPLPKIEKVQEVIVTGPFKFKTLVSGRKIVLEPNPHYKVQLNRPEVEALFIEDDLTARRMYDGGMLTFLRRVIVQDIAASRKDPEFFQIPMARFDYIGFGPELKSNPELRKALSLSVDFPEAKKLLQSLGELGCPSLPDSYLARRPCYKFDPAEAKKIWATLPKDKKPERLTLAFSDQGGEDIRTQMQWFQNQWKKNLGLQVDLQVMEDKMYIAKLQKDPPALFRKGVGLDRPDCLAGLEVFGKGNRENYLQINDPKLEQTLIEMRGKHTPKELQVLCTQAITSLMDQHLFVPLGEMHFSMMAKPQFVGWEVNEVNQLDLTHLQLKTE